jgi:LPXTG-motif cell wall-anchored protein
MRQRLITALVSVAVGVLGTVALAAAPAQASTFTGCTGPSVQVADEPAARQSIADINPAKCLDIQFVDKCDGTTVLTMTNWVFNDNKFTVLTVDVDGKEYTLKGGSDPNTEVVTVGPQVDGLQVHLVFRFKTEDGTVTVVKDYGDPWTWEEPKACPTVTPSPSVTATASASPSPVASPSVSVTGSVATSTTPAAAVSNNLPVTGASTTIFFVGAAALLVVAGGFMWLNRRRRLAETE